MQVGMTTALYGAHPVRTGASTDRQGNDAARTPDRAAALTEEDQREVERLKARDREVRAHEMAHLAVAGGLATSGARFSYEKGPDGVRYAVSGEVGIDVSPGRTPEQTLQRAQTIRAAALAPAEPSGQDRAVAAKATQMEAEARAELARNDTDDAEQQPLAAYHAHDKAEPGSQLDIHA